MSNATQHTRMIPYPVIEAAVHGETDAVNEVIRHYSGYIATLCRRTGCDKNGNYCTYVDEELRRRLETRPYLSRTTVWPRRCLLFPKRNAISSLCIGSWIWPTVILPTTWA